MAHAQVSIGLIVGPSLTNLSGTFIESSDLTSGIHMGAILEWQLNRRWSLDTGVGTLQEGAFGVGAAGEVGIWDVKTSYIHIPVRARYLLHSEDDRWTLGPFVGFGLSVLGSCKIRMVGLPLFDNECAVGEPGGEMASTDFMYTFGVVIDRVFHGSGYGFDIRYARGVRDVFKGAAESGLTSKNSSVDIKLRLIFPPFGGS